MKKLTVMLLALAMIGSVFAQEPVVRKIPIKHADPELVIRLLKGQHVQQPEMSTLMLFFRYIH